MIKTLITFVLLIALFPVQAEASLTKNDNCRNIGHIFGAEYNQNISDVMAYPDGCYGYISEYGERSGSSYSDGGGGYPSGGSSSGDLPSGKLPSSRLSSGRFPSGSLSPFGLSDFPSIGFSSGWPERGRDRFDYSGYLDFLLQARWPDVYAELPDVDIDFDFDTDGDGIPDHIECPDGIEDCGDTDGDGIPDHVDPTDDRKVVMPKSGWDRGDWFRPIDLRTL